MITSVLQSRLGVTDLSDRDAMIGAYQRHNDTVRAQAPPGQLLEWRPEDGWEPLAAALRLPAPNLPFPKVNTRAQFREPELGQRTDLSAPPAATTRFGGHPA
jgi:hypothetical protein